MSSNASRVTKITVLIHPRLLTLVLPLPFDCPRRHPRRIHPAIVGEVTEGNSIRFLSYHPNGYKQRARTIIIPYQANKRQNVEPRVQTREINNPPGLVRMYGCRSMIGNGPLLCSNLSTSRLGGRPGHVRQVVVGLRHFLPDKSPSKRGKAAVQITENHFVNLQKAHTSG